MILATHGLIASSGGVAFDADAAAFFARVTAAGGTLSLTEKTATNQLVLDLKANSLWTPMKAIYPMVGASAAACAQNLKSSSFTGTFTSGWTFASTGVTPNGTSAYMDTGLNPATVINDVNDGHLSYYSRTESTGTYIDIGCFNGTTAFDLVIKYSTVAGACINMSDGNIFGYTGTTKGHFIASQNNTNDVRKYYRDNAFSNTQNFAQNAQPSRNIVLGARDAISTIFTNRECAFASIGNGLTDGEAGLFYTAVQTFQTTLNRNV